MGVFWNIVRAVFIAAAIVAVAELSKRSPRYSATITIAAAHNHLGIYYELVSAPRLGRDLEFSPKRP